MSISDNEDLDAKPRARPTTESTPPDRAGNDDAGRRQKSKKRGSDSSSMVGVGGPIRSSERG